MGEFLLCLPSHLLISNLHFSPASPLRLISLLTFHHSFFFLVLSFVLLSPLLLSHLLFPSAPHFLRISSSFLFLSILFSPRHIFFCPPSTFLSQTHLVLFFPGWNITVPNTYLHPVGNFLVLFFPRGRR